MAEPIGKLSARIELHRDGQMVEDLEFGGRVEKAHHELYKVQYFRCSNPICSSKTCKPNKRKEFNTKLRADDVLVFILNYRKFPDIPEGDFAKVTTGVTH